MGLVRAQGEGQRHGDATSVPACPSRSPPGSAAPQRRRSSPPKRTPHTLGAAASPWGHRRGSPCPARAPGSSPPSLCASSRRPGAPAAPVLPPSRCSRRPGAPAAPVLPPPRSSRRHRPAGKRAPPSERGRRGCGAGEGGRWGVRNGACARGHDGTRTSARERGQRRRRALGRAAGRCSPSSAPLCFFADSWASGCLRGSFFRGAQKLANGPR